jgi:hypothetical protein
MALLGLSACGGGWNAADTTGNTVAARHEGRVLEACVPGSDAGTCTPELVTSHTLVAYCANARQLSAHGAPLPEAGVTCQP